MGVIDICVYEHDYIVTHFECVYHIDVVRHYVLMMCGMWHQVTKYVYYRTEDSYTG